MDNDCSYPNSTVPRADDAYGSNNKGRLRRNWLGVCGVVTLLVLAGISALLEHSGRDPGLVGSRNLRPTELQRPLYVEKVVYVPIYPSLYAGTTSQRSISMLVTLSLRNVSETEPTVISGVQLYDSDGRLIRRLVEDPRELGPMQTADFVARTGRDGGSGANFVVKWGMRSRGPDLLVEAVMHGQKAETGISFTTRGQVVSEAYSGAGMIAAAGRAEPGRAAARGQR